MNLCFMVNGLCYCSSMMLYANLNLMTLLFDSIHFQASSPDMT